MAKDAEAYNKKHGKQEGEKCETEMVDEGMINLLGCPVLCSHFWQRFNNLKH